MLSRILTLLTAFIAALTPAVEAKMTVKVHDSRVGCVQWRHGDMAATTPVTKADERDGLKLTFDLLATDGEDESWMPFLRCRVKHTDADGKPDGLVDSEFLDGFNLAEIGYGEGSEPGVTTVLYRHYSVEVPPSEIRARLSGNYLLEIHEAETPDKVIITAPFAIEEGSIRATGAVTGRTDTDWNGESQQLEIEVTNLNLDRQVRLQDLIVETVQNGDETTRRRLSHPSQTNGNKAIYAHQPELTYKGGNEYRRMETVSRKTPGMNVAEIAWDNTHYHHRLTTDTPRQGKAYSYDQTQNGEFTVREADDGKAVPSDTEADYTVVHFTLADSGILPPDAVVIDGALTGRRKDADATMEYDSENDVWRKSMLLKQGAYDYRYMKRNGATGEVSATPTEGNHHQTQNVYTVYVYYRIPGERTDRLAGVTTITAEANR